MVPKNYRFSTAVLSKRFWTTFNLGAGWFLSASLSGQAETAPSLFAAGGNKYLCLGASTGAWNSMELLATLGFLGGGLFALLMVYLQHRNLKQREQKLATLEQELAEHVRTEASLRESEALSCSLINTLPVGIYRKDAQGRFTFANTYFCQALGKSPAEIQGKTDLDLFPAALAKKQEADDSRVMREGIQYEEVERHPRPDGTQAFMQVFKVPIRNAKGEITGTQGMLWNVTARQQSQETLVRERDLLDALLQNTADRIYFKDLKSRFMKCSPTVAIGLGITKLEEILGKSDFDFFTEEHARAAYEDEQRIIRTGQPVIGLVEKETWLDGKQTWVLTNKMPLRTRDGQIIGTFGISKDITELKQIEQTLAYERDLLRSLLDGVPDCIYFKDKESRFIKCSGAMAERFGFKSSEELIGKTDFDFFDEAHARPAFEDEQEIIRSGKPVIGKTERETYPDGRVTWALSTKMPLRDKDGTVIGTFGVSKDITALMQAEEALKKAKDAAEQATRAKSDFLASMSHEIRTPMNGIIGMSNLLLDTNLNEEQRDFTETVRNSGEALLTIINDILDFSKIEAGKLIFETLDFDLRDVVEETLELLAERARQKNLELGSLVPREVPTRLRGDPGRIRQVLMNLIGNAIKFTAKGEVFINVTCEEDAATHARLRVEIIDSEIGRAHV